jgi:two-component system, chemotaxis family, CheB/CheR fusion protein
MHASDQPSTRLPVVGIGASAGGLEAFLELLSALPPTTGMAFVVVQHLEPNYASQLAEILSRSTEMPVVNAEDGKQVEANHVYVIPPNRMMTIEKGALHLAPRSESSKPHYPIDLFFESLAADQGVDAIGVILSGTASDGTQGIQAIKAQLGVTFCQDEGSARYGSMPHNAIATGAVDFVLPPAKIAEELAKINSNGYLTAPIEQLEDPLAPGETDGELQQIFDRLKNATKVDFTHYKQSTIRRRIGRRMVVHHLRDLREYVEYLERHPAEIHDLYRDVLISVTSFFREPPMFEALAKAIPEYLQTRGNNEPFRLWIPGCATGEEAYSLAILVFEILETLRKDLPVQVFGTDISESAIERSRSGVYPEKIAEDIPPERLQRFFSRIDSSYRIKQQIRDSCVFARHDLTSDPPFSQMDLVSCRNVFIYLTSSLQLRVLPDLHYSLKLGGLLVLGSAETVGSRSDLFGIIDNESKIYTRQTVPARLSTELRFPDGFGQRAPARPQPGSTPQSSAPADLEARAARILRDLYAPAGVLINDDLQVLHSHGQIEFYLDRATGEANPNLLRLARQDLVYPLRKAVDAAFAQKQPVHETGIAVQDAGHTRQIKLSVIPVSNETRFALVLFEEASANDGNPAVSQEHEPTSAELELSYAQRELAQTRDYLRRVIEQHEAVTEELRATNEEVRSANEELQSTNEELRTAKEQLQSSNEELTTVNDELKHRNDDLALVSNDLSNTLNAATIPIIMVGMDLRLRRFTPAAERLLGMAQNDVGRTVTEIPYPFQLPYLKNMLAETLQTLHVQQRRAQDSEGRWYDVFVRPYRTMDDRIEGAVITFIDVDDATRALKQAEHAREFEQGIVETVQHPLLVLDSDLRIVRATRAFYNTFFVRPEETLGQTIDYLGNGQWRMADLRRLLEQALVRDVPFRDLEITHDFPHIGTRTMRLNARRISGIEGNYSVLLAIEDVTERREAAEIQYRRLFESAKDGLIVLESPSGIVLDVNPFFLELCRYPKADFMNRPFREIPPFLDVKEMRSLVPETIEKGTMHYDSVPLRAKDRREAIVEIVANSYQVKKRSLIQVNIRDVTEKRRSEEDLRRSNLDLQQFAFAASHDLQEPLRTITSFLELFQRQNKGKLGPQADEHIGFIISAADRMKQLVLDLMGFSQVARSEMNFSEVSVEGVLSTVLLNLQMAIQSSHARITFDHLPVVYADEIQMHRLLQNLISNAIKYQREEAPQIHLSVREAGSEWVFSVQDNGIGMEMKYADHIFTVFKRLHGREYPGTGIGLAICKRIVERHGGRIWVESQPNAGATFYFTLPRRMKR